MRIPSRWVKVEPKIEGPIKDNSTYQGVSIKPRIDALLFKIDKQIVKFGLIIDELKSIDDKLLKKRALSINENNSQYSAVLSLDIAHSRRIIKIVHFSKIAFEKLKNKLQGISNFGDIVNVLSPAMAVVKSIRACLVPCIPESEEELVNISELLGCILIDAGQVGGHIINFKVANEEAVRLLNEASLTAEEDIKKIFIDIPN
jgi:division protein CdvB (Snf7/Vps24/ESCRT-III family)